MKIASLIVLLCTAMGLTGAGSAIHFRPGSINATLTTHHNWIFPAVEPPVLLAYAQSGTPVGERLAATDEKLTELTNKAEVSDVERKDIRMSIHELQIQQMDNFALEEKARVDDFNKLTGRMDVAEARIVTAGTVVSLIFSAALALLLFFHIDEKWSNLRVRRSLRKDYLQDKDT